MSLRASDITQTCPVCRTAISEKDPEKNFESAKVFFVNVEKVVNQFEFTWGSLSSIQKKELDEGLVRAQSSYVTKNDLERLIKDKDINLAEIRKDLRSLGAEVRGCNRKLFFANTLQLGFGNDLTGSTQPTVLLGA
jgi:hypothetical protein